VDVQLRGDTGHGGGKVTAAGVALQKIGGGVAPRVAEARVSGGMAARSAVRGFGPAHQEGCPLSFAR
jgi:hypothetical protein